MIHKSLNHCKKMGADPGRRFLKQPALKLEPVIVDIQISTLITNVNLRRPKLKHYMHNGLSTYQIKYCKITFLALTRLSYITFNCQAVRKNTVTSYVRNRNKPMITTELQVAA